MTAGRGRRPRRSTPPGRPEPRRRSSPSAAVRRAPRASTSSLETVERDQSYCHTIGYTSPLLAGHAVGRLLSGSGWTPADGGAIRALMAAGLGPEATAAAESIAAGLAGSRPILVVASGADRTAARELVLKLEEGTWIPPRRATSRRSSTATCRRPTPAPGSS